MEIRYWVNYFDRELVVKLPDGYEHLEKEILKMLENYYIEWLSPEDIEDEDERKYVKDSFCEEYMMERLSETYNMWEEWWLEDEKEDPFESEHNKNNQRKAGSKMNYKEFKKEIDAINSKYTSAGDIVFKCAIQNVMEYGRQLLNDDNYLKQWLESIDRKHYEAKQKGKHLFVTRDFEKAIAECTRKLAAFDTINLLQYMQREMWFSNDMHETSYQSAIALLQGVVECALDNVETSVALDELYCMGFDDSDIIYLGYDGVFFNNEDEYNE